MSKTLKHLYGQHDQKRHGWRYGKDGRGPLFTDEEERAVFDERYSTRHRITESELANAKAFISMAQDRYISEIAASQNNTVFARGALRVARVEKAKEEELREKWAKTGKILEDKKEAFRKQKNEHQENLDELYSKGFYGSRKYNAVQKKIWALESKISKINDRLYSDKKLVALDQKIREQADIRKQAESYALSAIQTARFRSTESGAASTYLYTTGEARKTVLNYYVAEGDRLRRRGEAIVKRNERWAKYYREKVDAISNQLYSEMNEYHQTATARFNFYETERGKNLLAQRSDLYKKIEHYENLAKNAFSGSLNQSRPANTGNIGTEDVLSGDTGEWTQKGIDAFASLIGRNKLFEYQKTFVVTSGEKYTRATYGEGVLYTGRVAKLDSDNRHPSYIESSKRDLARSVVHELGHALEQYDPGIRSMVVNFYKRRTANSPVDTLFGELKIGHLDFSEYTKPDKFVDKYMGKTYGREDISFGHNMFATEILSMGLEMFYTNPVKLAKDADMFNFIYAVVRMNE